VKCGRRRCRIRGESKAKLANVNTNKGAGAGEAVWGGTVAHLAQEGLKLA